MTTGSWDRGNSATIPTAPGGFYWKKSWTGADRAPLPKAPLKVSTVCLPYTDKKGRKRVRCHKVYWRERSGPTGNWRPPKRSYDVPHNYSMSERYAREYSYTLQNSGCPPPFGGCKPGGYESTGVLFRDLGYPTWAAANLITANQKLELIGRLRRRINGSDFNLAVFLAEALESCDMISATAKKLARAYAFAHSGRWVQAARTLSDGPVPSRIRRARESDPISGHWLELQYGWLPLLQDVKAAAELLAHQLNVPFRKRYHVEERLESTLTQTGRRSWATNCCPITYDNASVQYRSGSTRTQIYALTCYVTEAPTIPQLLGLTNPTSVLWEKLPYSFVADWFLPIGQWLDARGLASDLVGTFVESDLRKGVRHVPDLSDYKATITLGQGSPTPWVDIQFTRTVSSSLSSFVPMPQFKPLNEALTWKHAANAVALLVQRYGSSGTATLFKDSPKTRPSTRGILL